MARGKEMEREEEEEVRAKEMAKVAKPVGVVHHLKGVLHIMQGSPLGV